MRLDGKICAVTGASSGIGEAIARALAVEGGRVVGMARRLPAGPATPPEAGQVHGCALDVTDEAAVEARFGELEAAGGVDVLVCSAGVGAFGPVVSADVAGLRSMLDVHVVGAFMCCRAAARGMTARGRGHIVTIGSVATRATFTDCSGYTAAKMGLLGLTRVLAEELRPDVRVTAVTPGAVDTPIWDGRPGFDRTKMMSADDLASLVVEVVTRPALSVDELVIVPPGGNL